MLVYRFFGAGTIQFVNRRRTLGLIMELKKWGMEDITFSRSMQIIIDALMEAAMEYFHITESQLGEFTEIFISHLPQYMQKALETGLIAA